MCFENQDRDCVLADGRMVMSKTAAFDAILFTYYKMLDVRPQDVLTYGLPDVQRAIAGWAVYLAKHAESRGLVPRVWERLRERGHADEKSACRLTRELARGGGIEVAWRIWSEFRADAYSERTEADRVTNGRFQRRPLECPFDWQVTPQTGAKITTDGRLHIEFDSTANLTMANVGQTLHVRPGRHRLVVDASHADLTTNQGPYVRVFGDGPGGSWAARTEMFLGSSERRQTVVEFVIPPGSSQGRIQIERQTSEKFDNKIGGSLDLYQVSLLELGDAGGNGQD